MSDETAEKISTETPETGTVFETGPLLVKLLYDRPTTISKELLTAKLQSLDTMIKSSESDLCLFFNDRYQLKDIAGNAPAPILVSPLESLNSEEQMQCLQQTWDWPESKSILPYCNHGIIVADIVGAAFPAKDRLTYFQTILAGVLESYPPQVISWTTSQRLTQPSVTAQKLKESDNSSVLAGAVNVRSYRDQQNLSHHILDTLGLAYFGLPDFQCHFHSLEIGAVAAVLYDLVACAYEHGNVIGTGNTVAGVGSEMWKCSLEWSLVAPRRAVIDLHPGDQSSARKSQTHSPGIS